MPSPFKIYPDLEPISLPRDLVRTGAPALSVVGADRQFFPESVPYLNSGHLASLLFYSAGVTKKKSYPGGEIYFRAAACAGALYPVETYIVCRELDGLGAGVYHFNPGDFSLRQLRTGDYRPSLIEASGDYEAMAKVPLFLVFTAISWRSTWKYRDRAYRYHFWDNGMIMANAMAMSEAHGLQHHLVLGFVDKQINRLIGIDGRREIPLSILAIGQDESADVTDVNADTSDLHLNVIPLSHSEVEYPSIIQMHDASSLESSEEVRTWRSKRIDPMVVANPGEHVLLDRLDEADNSNAIEDVIQRRASTRRFAPRPIQFSELSVILDRATRGIRSDFTSSPMAQLNQIYLIAHRVEGLASGTYVYSPDLHVLIPLAAGDFSEKTSHLSLDQDLGGGGAATLFFMADLNPLLERLGNRAYRAVQLEAGIQGGKAYLSSYSLGRGATGLTFYDDEVTDFLSPHAAGRSAIFEIAIGVPGKKPLF
jgi:SagB-type dehydrogenase family enzyme